MKKIFSLLFLICFLSNVFAQNNQRGGLPPVVMAAPPNNACANAISLGTVSTTTTTTGTNVNATADGTYSGCHSPTDNVWYKFIVPAGGGSYNITVTGGSIVDPCLSLNSGACGSQTEITCSYGFGSSSSIVHCLTAGTYYISVDDDFGTEGTFSITVTQTGTGGVPVNDACAGAIALGTVSTTTTTTGNNSCATADKSSNCHTPTENIWYTFTVPAGGGSYVVSVAGGTIVDPCITVYSGACGSLTNVNCTYGLTTTASVNANCLAAGTYYINVDDDGGTAGTFSLTVTQTSTGTSVANDACGSAITLGTVSTTTTTTGSNSCATADKSSNCHTPTENVWYKFTVPAGGGSYLVSVAGGTIVDPCITVYSGACGSLTNVNCTYGLSTTASVNASCLSAGTYFINVDDDGGAAGTFSLTVTQTSAGAISANDNCSGAINLGTVSSTTTTAGNNNCATADESYFGCHSPTDNVWFMFTVPAGGGNYLISVASGTLVDPTISVNSGVCGSLTEIVCTSGSTSSASVNANCLTAGTYYIAVDDDFGTEGTFSLTVTQISAGITLANDPCSGAISLGTVSTTTTTTGNNLCATSDQSSSSCFTFAANVWYKFTVPAGGGSYNVNVNCNTMYEPAVAVFSGTCGAFTQLGCNNYCSFTTATTTSVSASTGCLAPGTYYIAVDDDASGCSGTMGTFSLTVVQTSAGGPPTNDDCTSPITLTTGSTLSTTNKCASSYNDPDPDCYTPATSATVWYAYTPTTSGNATFSLTPGTIKWPAMALYTGSCGAFTEVGCISASAITTIASLSASCLTAGVTYYIMIDNNGHNNSATGTFSITTTFTTVAAGPSNDCCTNPANIPSLNGTCNGGYTTLGATYDQYEFGCFNNTTNSHNVWFSFVAQGPNVTINVNGGASFNPEVSIFTATNLCSVSTATGIGCATATGASVTVSNSQSLVTGQTYYIMVDNNQTGTAGSFSICVNNTVAPPSPGQDCKTGLQVCNSSSLGGNASGTGSVTDLNGTTEGCLSGEHQSNWFIVTINTGGTLTMTISPTVSGDDYDFALWGPTTTCPISSAPINCNYSASASPPQTGMTTTVSATTSQGAGGTQWNSPPTVATGSTYILLVDNFSATTEPFTLNWGGTAVLSCNPVIILPIELIHFTGELNDKEVDLKWSTASENNNAYFTIERSADGKNFEKLIKINSQGNSTKPLNYSTIDFNPLPGISYYRLSQTDVNGITRQFNIVTIKNTNDDGKFTAIPNPTEGIVNITYSCDATTMGTLKLFDSNGGLVLSKDITCVNGQNTSQLDLSTITPGIYMITFSTDTKFYRTKLMKR